MEPPPQSTVILGDCIDVKFPPAALLYCDAPWGSGARREGRAGGYDDALVGPGYLQDWLVPRILHAAEAVTTGWIVLHHDPLIGARAMVALEAHLGEAYGIVSYQDSWVSGFRSRAASFFPRVHDVIVFWKVGAAPFHPTLEPAPPGYKRRGSNGETPAAPRPLGDLWVGPWSPGHLSFSKEKVGWPDQKPLALLTRIIEATTNPGDTVLDCFCGSGTTLVAAAAIGRRGFGVDISPEAVAVARGRLSAYALR